MKRATSTPERVPTGPEPDSQGAHQGDHRRQRAWNSIELPEGRFSTQFYRLNVKTQFSPYIALVNNIQYDSQSAVLGWQSRFRWILRPGNDLFVVYTHNWLDDPQLSRFSMLDKRLASKLLCTYRF